MQPAPCGLFYACNSPGAPERPQRHAAPKPPAHAKENDLNHHGAEAQRQHDKIKHPATKIALHRTRLRFLDLEIFSVLFFYKPDRQAAPPLAACRKTQTEKIEKNFIILQFHGSKKDLTKNITIRNIKEKYILCGMSGSLDVLLSITNKARNRWRGAG